MIALPVYELYELDIDNGEVIYREYYDADEARRALEEYIREAEKEGWSCSQLPDGRYVCTKCDEEGCYNRELGVREV